MKDHETPDANDNSNRIQPIHREENELIATHTTVMALHRRKYKPYVFHRLVHAQHKQHPPIRIVGYRKAMNSQNMTSLSPDVILFVVVTEFFA